MIAGMAPVLSDGRYVFAETRDPALLARAFAVVRETEGTTASHRQKHGGTWRPARAYGLSIPRHAGD
jgi:hypothetical protein